MMKRTTLTMKSLSRICRFRYLLGKIALYTYINPKNIFNVIFFFLQAFHVGHRLLIYFTKKRNTRFYTVFKKNWGQCTMQQENDIFHRPVLSQRIQIFKSVFSFQRVIIIFQHHTRADIGELIFAVAYLHKSHFERKLLINYVTRTCVNILTNCKYILVLTAL